jgi:YVTN family beta-propeller protein
MRADAARHLLRLGLLACAFTAALPGAVTGWAEEPLVLEAKIPLGDVSGRIDHMAFDAAHQRLFVAELGNDSVGVVDVEAKKTIRTISHLKEPQGVGYVASSDTLYVANANDGSVRLFRGSDYAPAGTIDLGDDADNVRVDAKTGQVFIGYGSGGIAVLDAAAGQRRGDIKLRGHPEAFQLAPADRIYVNVPDERQIAVLDRTTQKQVASWPTRDGRGNFPMALGDDGARVVTVFRNPPRLAVLSATDGRTLASTEVCGDADDVFVDARRHRLYVSCGEGVVDVLERRPDGYVRLARVPTSSGARTSLFIPELDRLFVGVRASGGIVASATPAAIWVFRPSP